MDAMNLEQVVRNIDRRLDRVEQFLPTLATREETHAAIREAVAPLATREEMHTAIREAVAPLATKDDMRAFEQRIEQKIADETDQARAQSRALFESLKDDIHLLAEGVVSIQATLEQTIRPILGNHERRITVLEAGRGPAPVRRRS